MPKLSAHLSMMFAELPFLERFEAAARAGFKTVELGFAYEHDPDDIAERLRRFNLRCNNLNAPPGDYAAGDRGIAIFADRVEEFRKSVRLALLYADKLDCPNVHVMAGTCGEAARAEYQRVYEENLRFACTQAAAQGRRILIEPMNPVDRPRYLLSTQAQADETIARVGEKNLYLMMDLYHIHMSEGGIADKLERYRDRIGHIQISDAPGRHEPGSGEINFRPLFALIDRLGYRGWVGCEYQSRGPTVAGLHWIEDHGLSLDPA
jgi:hydroxypyruvate isomerase